MADFNIQIAGQVFSVSSMFESTRDYCCSYLTQNPPAHAITIVREDLEFEQQKLLEEALNEGFRIRHFPDPYLERASVQRKIAERLLRCDTLLFHGSAVAVDGEGYLFTAKCGTGKSTHTRLWRQVFANRAVMINDDQPFLRITNTEVLVCGSPWSGKHGLNTNITVPLKGICILERGAENRIWKAAPEEASFLLKQSRQPQEPCRLPSYLELVATLAKRTALWHMECTKEPQTAMVSYEAMSGRREQK